MEDALALLLVLGLGGGVVVLILVVMEDALAHVAKLRSHELDVVKS